MLAVCPYYQVRALKMKLIDKIKDLDEYTKITTISILIVSIAGILPSILFEEWEWFSRSGALLIVYGVYIVWLDYEGWINNDLETLKSGVIKKFGEKSEQYLKLFDEVRDANSKRYDKFEFIIISTGTVIWGYGNLINNIYS
jgi:hypothetical protein